jgi:hypothetical protein
VPKTSKSTTPEAVKNAAIVRRLSRTLRLRAALVMSDAIDECPFRFNGKGTTAFLLRLKKFPQSEGFKKDVAPAAVAGALFVVGARLTESDATLSTLLIPWCCRSRGARSRPDRWRLNLLGRCRPQTGGLASSVLC